MQKLSLVALCFALLTFDCSSPLPSQSGEIRLNEWKTVESARTRPTDGAPGPDSEIIELEPGFPRPRTWMGKPFSLPKPATVDEVQAYRRMLSRLVKSTRFPRYSEVPLGPESMKRIQAAKALIQGQDLPRAYAWRKVLDRLAEPDEGLRFYREDKSAQARLDPRAMSIRYVAPQRAFMVDVRGLLNPSTPLEVIAQRLVNVTTRAVEHDEQNELSGYDTQQMIALSVFCGDIKRMRIFVSDALASYNEALWLHAKPERVQQLAHTIMPMTLHEWLLHLDGNRSTADEVARGLWSNSGTSVMRVSGERRNAASAECRFPIKIRTPEEGEPYVMTDVAPEILVPLVDGIPPQI